jgi:hypothetical protein
MSGLTKADLQKWVRDLQSGMYVNCVYCGHRYGPGETTPVSMADALKAHIEKCPEHPMSKMREALSNINLICVQAPPCDELDEDGETYNGILDSIQSQVRKCFASDAATEEK